jgi:predicted CXXCH cytochrome family protein
MGLQRFALPNAVKLFSINAVLLTFSLALLSTAGAAQKRPNSLQGPSVAARTPDYDAPASAFAGEAACRDCHKDEVIEFDKTAHSKLTFPDKPYIQGCETCHGPGKSHADAVQAAHGDDAEIAKALKEHPIFAFKANPTENAEHCLGCHTTSKMQDFFGESEHVSHGVACNECHSSHLVDEVRDLSKTMSSPQAYFFQVPKLPEETRWLHSSLLKESEPQLCYGCHQTIQAAFALPDHHRVPEGLMKCSDCHNPHGTENFASLTVASTNVNETCEKCHIEKHGPFVYEHPAVSVSGCITCHNPHGTATQHLLVRREGRQLCLECHTGFHNQPGVPHGRLGFQTSGECVRCHVAIHGSNLDPNFLR